MGLQLVGSIGLMNYTMLCLSERKKVQPSRHLLQVIFKLTDGILSKAVK